MKKHINKSFKNGDKIFKFIKCNLISKMDLVSHFQKGKVMSCISKNERDIENVSFQFELPYCTYTVQYGIIKYSTEQL